MAVVRLITGAAACVAVALFCFPASAAKTCVIVISPGTNGDWAEKYWHEMAHCNGWVHPRKATFVGSAYHPPKRYLYVYPGPLDARFVSIREARRLCDGHFGCQWFE